MASNLAPIAQLLEASLDPRQHKQAEAALKQEEAKPGFSLQLLHITASETFAYNTRLASALCFKNFIKRNWTDEEGQYKLPQSDVVTIKQELISLMISVPTGIQSQLGEAVSVIADSDFWERWDTLVDDLVSRLSPENIKTNIGVLQVAHSIFKRWRPLFRSDDLYREINHVLGKFGLPYLALFESLDAYIEKNKDNKENLTLGFTQLNLMIKLFYDLSSHDLPPMFEENLGAIATLFLKYLMYDNKLLHTDDDSESGVLEFVKAGTFEALTLYVQKYLDVFGSLVEQFIGSSWNLLTTIGQETKYDILVSKALQFLTSIAKISEHAAAFQNEGTLGQVTEKVILPNITLRESDVEMFEDEPIEFIRRDLEGSDSDTRRRAATDFLRQLLQNFEDLVTTVVLRYVEHYLADYAKSPSDNWKSKDTAVYLYSSIAAKGVATTSHGVTTINYHVNITKFFQKNIASDLVAETGVQPILKVDAIKYLYSFRSIITKEQWREIMPLLVKHLASSDYVVYTYAAIAVERVFVLTDASGAQIVPASDITPLAGQLLEHLFQLVQKESSAPKVQENEFIMKCIMRVLVVIKDAAVPQTESILNHLIQITEIISSNPSNPRFYYYHFEALGALIRFTGPSQPDKLGQALYTPFFTLLRNDLLAALLEVDPTGSFPDYFKDMIAPILAPVMWEQKGNVPALVRLLQAIVRRGADILSKNSQIEPILGIFQKLVSSKINESYGFDLLETVISTFPSAMLQSYFPTILQIILTRLQNSKTENFSLRFVRFYHFLSAHLENGYGADFFIQCTENIQNGVFTPIYLSIILPESRKLARPLDRKIAIISFAKTLAYSEAFASRYKKGWGFTCEPYYIFSTRSYLITGDDVEDMAFGVGFTQLTTIKMPPRDPCPETGPQVVQWVATYLKEQNSKSNGKIQNFAQERLDPQILPGLAKLLA
ncbi:chromosome segregation protein Cse1 [Trichophyton equinum CBS 127.97]|uniref:Chromosome segregation protein Cse1 n=1 Tax=Trichophyton equinum (strain ATCC MYA-4606 / CBS 127.97) TaxID=559882 RepID=F2Q016_TRIEC|nr:chromosome segregation protein Cse1 [Trichophyton equinum CBS 127.97]